MICGQLILPRERFDQKVKKPDFKNVEQEGDYVYV